MAHIKFHARTTLRDVQRAFGGPSRFTLRGTDSGELRAHGRYAWTVDDLLARLGDVAAQDRLDEGGRKAMLLIERAIDNEFGRGIGPRAAARAQEKKGSHPVSLADLRVAAEEVATDLAQQRMGMRFVKLLMDAADAQKLDREWLRGDMSGVMQVMSKAVLDLERLPGRELGSDDYRRAAHEALLEVLSRRLHGEPAA